MNIFNDDFKDFIRSLNQHNVEYILVGGYAVILRGYSRSTGDMDIWVNKTKANFQSIQKAAIDFGLPLSFLPEKKFFSEEYDVFTFGRPPFAIEILTAIKGVTSFDEAYDLSTIETVDELDVRVIHLTHLRAAKRAAGRGKDQNDLENLPTNE